MTIVRKIKTADTYMGRLSFGCDLLGELTNICVQEDIRCGRIEGIGAVSQAQIGYYNQKTREYQYTELNKRMEILKLTGNVSEKDGEVSVHAHITLADSKQRAYGGHLCEGTTVFACEYIIQEFEGAAFEREYDRETDLTLWKYDDGQ